MSDWLDYSDKHLRESMASCVREHLAAGHPVTIEPYGRWGWWRVIFRWNEADTEPVSWIMNNTRRLHVMAQAAL